LPNRSGDGPTDGGINTAPPGTEGYLLRSRSQHAALGRSISRAAQDALFEHPGLQPFVDHPPDNTVSDLYSQLPRPTPDGYHDADRMGALSEMSPPSRRFMSITWKRDCEQES
jgi:hypothetical protein